MPGSARRNFLSRGFAVTRVARLAFAGIFRVVKLPVVNQPVSLLIKGKAHLATCVDVFDGGYGYYFDAVFPKKTRHKFSTGEQCGVPELGPNRLADFVSYPKSDSWTVRFLLPKWS